MQIGLRGRRILRICRLQTDTLVLGQLSDYDPARTNCKSMQRLRNVRTTYRKIDHSVGREGRVTGGKR